MTARQAGVLLVATALVAPAAARAADPTLVVAGVRVAAPTCPVVPLSVPAFLDALRVELAGRSGRGATFVALAVEPCDTATTRVKVTVSDETSGRGFAREVGFDDVAPTARPRTLALVVAELVRAAEPTSAPPALGAPLILEAPPLARPAPRPLALIVSGDALLGLFPSRDTTLWGARLGFTGQRERWHFGGFVDAATGDRSFADGYVRLQWIGAGLAAGPRWASGRASLSPGLVGVVSWGHIEGHTSDPLVVARSGDALTAAVRGRVLFAWALGLAVTARAFVEGGWQVVGFDATVDGARAAGLSGASLVAGLGLGFTP